MIKPLSIVINNSFKQNIFPNDAKVACDKPLDKKTKSKHSISDIRTDSILNTFSRIYEKFSKDFLVSQIEMFLLLFFNSIQTSYNTQDVFIKVIEEWRENLDKNFFAVAVLTDLSKAFDCIPQNLLIATLSAYGLSNDSLSYIHSYLKDLKKCVQINNKQNEFDTIISGVPQCLIFGLILFNIFSMFFSFLFQKRPFIILRQYCM